MSRTMEGVNTICMGCFDGSCDFKPIQQQRRSPGPRDVLIDIIYCGVCHTDVLVPRGELDAVLPQKARFPCVPGHEVAGVAVAVGSEVSKFKVGDQVGVGYFVDSCTECKSCKAGEEQECPKLVPTVNGVPNDRSATVPADQGYTMGGFSTCMTVDERYAVKIPQSYPLEYAGPIMCAGVTTYSPLKNAGVTKGSTVGVVGVGGLGVMAIKLAKSLGCEVTAISRSANKETFARKCGADKFVNVSSSDSVSASAKSLDLIVNTVPVTHNSGMYEPLLKSSGKQVLIGPHEEFMAAMTTSKLWGDKSNLGVSLVGSVATLQEVMDLCDKNRIFTEIKVVPITQLNDIFALLSTSNDEGLRYVLDVKKTLTKDTAKNYSAQAPVLGPKAPPVSKSKVLGRTIAMNVHTLKRTAFGG